MPGREKKYISKNFQRTDIGKVKIEKIADNPPELTLETSIPLEDADIPELEDLSLNPTMDELDKVVDAKELLK